MPAEVKLLNITRKNFMTERKRRTTLGMTALKSTKLTRTVTAWLKKELRHKDRKRRDMSFFSPQLLSFHTPEETYLYFVSASATSQIYTVLNNLTASRK
jgi:hypothetical protein